MANGEPPIGIPWEIKLGFTCLYIRRSNLKTCRDYPLSLLGRGVGTLLTRV